MITIDHMRHMKDRAIVCNIGRFDCEIWIDALRNCPWEEVKPQVDDRSCAAASIDERRQFVLPNMNAVGQLINIRKRA